MENILEKIENGSSHVENLRSKLIVPKKIQLHTGMEGFDSPKAYGIYRNTGGNALGIVGESFNPMNLSLFLDSVSASIANTDADLDVSKLEYHEYKKGSVISFTVPLKKFEIPGSSMVGDVVETKLTFTTGFDGKTKTTLGYYTKRLWCTNGAANWDKAINISFKNTKNSQGRVFMFCDQIIQTIDNVESYVEQLSKLTKKSITQKDIDKYYMRVFGIDREKEEKLSTRTRNILDSINQSVAIEMQNTGDNMFSLLQGVTRYTSRKANFSEEKIRFTSLANVNERAHRFAFEMN